MNKRQAKKEVAGWLAALTAMPEEFEDQMEELGFDDKDRQKLIQALDELGREIAKRHNVERLS